jgi:von Willebrand factor type A domain
MRSRKRSFEVYSLSAIDLFASAMGAFIIMTIIMMPDYQNKVRSQGDLAILAEFAGKTEAQLDESEAGLADIRKALQAAQVRRRELEAQEDVISSELAMLNAELQARNEQPPPPPPIEELVEEDEPQSNKVSFRFLGLKTKKMRILFLIDMNGYLAQHQALVSDTVMRALDSLQPGYEFSILGFQELDSGPKYYRWPDGNGLAKVSKSTRGKARRFLDGLAKDFRGASSVLGAFEQAYSSKADAIIFLSDGLPNPQYNDGLSPSRLVRTVTLANTRNKEIHTVTIGDYFKYQGTVEFMEALARANSGGFLALAQ